MNNCQKYQGCPALMSDGRHMTDYRPSCIVNYMTQVQNGIMNQHKYRVWMQRNADKLRAIDRQNAQKMGGCTAMPYYHVDPNGHDESWSKYRKYIGLSK